MSDGMLSKPLVWTILTFSCVALSWYFRCMSRIHGSSAAMTTHLDNTGCEHAMDMHKTLTFQMMMGLEMHSIAYRAYRF